MKVSKYLDPDIIKDGTIDGNKIKDCTIPGDKKIKNYPPLEIGSAAYSVQQVLCNATSNYSFAEGLGTKTSGGGAHAEGEYTIASGFCSHTEGERTKTSGSHSHAEGYYTTTSNQGEHAEGKNNISIKDKTIHTVGIGTEDSDRKNAHEIHTDGKHYIFGIGGFKGNNSQTEGIKTLQEVVNGKQDKLTAGAGISIDENNTISIDFDPDIFKVVTELPTSPIEGDERKIHLVPTSDTEGGNAYDEYIYVDGTWEKIGSFRPSIDLSDYAKTMDIPVEKGTGTNSVVQKGSGSTASGSYSFAEGDGATASGVCSHAEGKDTKALGNYSHAEGGSATASSYASHAEGQYTIASGAHSHAEGTYTTAYGDSSHAEGYGSKKLSLFTVTGEANTTTYTTSTNHGLKVGQVVVYNNVYRRIVSVPSDTSFIVDRTLSSAALNGVIYIVYGVAYGKCSHVEGDFTTASGVNSHAEGGSARASGTYSHAEGFDTTASGMYSHAEGDSTTAYGISSHAEGDHTIASGGGSHAEGMYNYDNSSFIHMTGIGVDDSHRLNALSITHSGQVYIKGVGGYAGQGPIGNDLSKHLNSTDLTDYEIDVIFGTDVNAELNINSIYIDNLDGEYPDYPDWYESFGVNDKYEFVDTVIRDGEVSGPSKSFNINQSHRFMNTDHLTLTYEGVDYFIFKDINGDDIDGAGGAYRILINPNIDTYAAVSEHQLYGSTTSDGKYKFTMLNPDTDELYNGAPNMWSRQYVYYVEKVSN